MLLQPYLVLALTGIHPSSDRGRLTAKRAQGQLAITITPDNVVRLSVLSDMFKPSPDCQRVNNARVTLSRCALSAPCQTRIASRTNRDGESGLTTHGQHGQETMQERKAVEHSSLALPWSSLRLALVA